MCTGYIRFFVIYILFSCANVFASPMLLFDSARPYLLLGVNNIELNDEYFDIRFNWQDATVFADQNTADEASHALVEQVFSQDIFSSLNLCNKSGSCGASSVWLGTYPGWYGNGVSQLWGDINDPCPAGSVQYKDNCGYHMNQSGVVFSPDGGISINNFVGAVGYLMACGDCGSITTVWTKQVYVSESASLVLFSVALIGFIASRRKRLV